MVNSEVRAIGAELLSGGSSELMQMAELIALCHHEKFDGTGYPRGLDGERIPLVARVVAVCDVFDALLSKRPYKAPWTVDAALEETCRLQRRVRDAMPQVKLVAGDTMNVVWTSYVSAGAITGVAPSQLYALHDPLEIDVDGNGTEEVVFGSDDGKFYALDPQTGKLVAGDAAAQAERAIENLGAVLCAAGYHYVDVVKTTIFLVDMNDFAAVNTVYEKYFGLAKPARSTVAVAALPRGARVEIDCIAKT